MNIFRKGFARTAIPIVTLSIVSTAGAGYGFQVLNSGLDFTMSGM